MGRYIIRRVLWGVVLLVVVAALLFLMFRFLPTADPAKLRAGRLQSPQIIAAMILGLCRRPARSLAGSAVGR